MSRVMEASLMRIKPTRRQFLVRLDEDIRQALDIEARRNVRSVTAEIGFRLRRSLELEERQPEEARA